MSSPLGILERAPAVRPAVPALAVVAGLSAIALTAALVAPLARLPGIYLALDGRAVATPSRLPSAGAPDLARVGAVATLVSAQGEGVYLLEGRILQGRDALAAELRRIASDPSRRALPVLAKADRSLTLQSLADLTDAARAAGFPGVLIAADRP
jgi:biopolymer transport protein ExbD